MFDKQDDSGVSPVIGVILMVAVTVALVALVTVTVFDLGGDVSESPDATVQLQQIQVEDGSGNQADAIRGTLLRNENVETLYLAGPGAGTGSLTPGSDAQLVEIGSDAGATGQLEDDSGSYSGDFAFSNGDTFNVIAEMPDGTTEVLTSTEYNA